MNLAAALQLMRCPPWPAGAGGAANTTSTPSSLFPSENLIEADCAWEQLQPLRLTTADLFTSGSVMDGPVVMWQFICFPALFSELQPVHYKCCSLAIWLSLGVKPMWVYLRFWSLMTYSVMKIHRTEPERWPTGAHAVMSKVSIHSFNPVFILCVYKCDKKIISRHFCMTL